MNFSLERPYALLGLLFLIPAVFYTIHCFKSLNKSLTVFYNEKVIEKNRKSQKRMKRNLLLRCILRFAAWTFLVLSYAGFSWGLVSVPVQKSGVSVSCVFDISYSMTALDAPGSLSRLEASSAFADMLLSRMDDCAVSAVLAKGEGIIAIPLTEDMESVRSLLHSLSPEMMSTAGSSLGRGIEAAIRSFPRNSSQAHVIWLFTDGDETDKSLEPALTNAVKRGIPVVIIGFGSETETEVTAGDGVTTVKTALRSKLMQEVCENVNKRNGINFDFFKAGAASYVDATEVGSALKILSSVKTFGKGNDDYTMAYEMQIVNRHKLFLALAVILYVLSFVFYEFNIPTINRKSTLVLLSLTSMLFISCSASLKDSKAILDSTWSWYQGNYNDATEGFITTISEADTNNKDYLKQYALYGLSVTYLMQNETEASLDRISQISKDAPEKIRFASLYNSGIIQQRKGNYREATEFFKKALLVEPSSVDAKINLELSYNQELQRVKEAETEMAPASENQNDVSSAEKSIFNRMKENDEKQWKNQQQDDNKKNDSVIDY